MECLRCGRRPFGLEKRRCCALWIGRHRASPCIWRCATSCSPICNRRHAGRLEGARANACCGAWRRGEKIAESSRNPLGVSARWKLPSFALRRRRIVTATFGCLRWLGSTRIVRGCFRKRTVSFSIGSRSARNWVTATGWQSASPIKAYSTAIKTTPARPAIYSPKPSKSSPNSRCPESAIKRKGCSAN